jgi:hypothetical protein
VRGFAIMPDGTPAAHALIMLEFTEREWLEIGSSDAQGRFEVKIYEGFKYLLAAEVRNQVQGVWRGTHSPAVELSSKESNDAITLSVSQPGFYRVRFAERKKQGR